MVLTQAEIVQVMLHSFAAMVKVFLVGAVGYFCAVYPKDDPFLNPNAMRNISRLCNFILIPPLIISSIGGSISIDLLGRMGILILFSLMTTFISYALSFTLGRAIIGGKESPKLAAAIDVAIGSPNIVAVPLMVIQTLCTQSNLNHDFNDSSISCFTEGTSMLFVYSIGWNIVFWSYGYPRLSSLGALSDEIGTKPTQPITMQSLSRYLKSDEVAGDVYKWCRHVLLSQNMVAIYIGVFIGLIEPLRNLIFGQNAALQPLGETVLTLGQPVVCLNSLIMAASLARVDLFQKRRAVTEYRPFVSQSTTVNALHADDAEVEKERTPTVVNVNEVSSDHGITVDLNCHSDSTFKRPHWRSIAAMFLCRLILPGLVILPVLEVFVQSGVISQDDRLAQFVIILEAVVPPAQTVVVSLNQLGYQDVAGQLAYLYIFQYLAMILTLTAWTTLSLGVIY